MRFLLLAALLPSFLAGCSSENAPESKAAEAEAPKAASTPPPTPPPVKPPVDPLVEKCGNGDGAACVEASMFAQACLHGVGDGCAKQAEAAADQRAKWLGRACRRGIESACGDKAKPVALEVLGRSEGPIADRIISVYQFSVADCFAERKPKSKTTVTVDVELGKVAKTNAKTNAKSASDALRDCVAAQMTGWAFPGADSAGEARVAVEFGLRKEERAVAVEGAAIQEKIANTALMAVLTGDGLDGRFGGTITGTATDLDQGASLDKQINDIRNRGSFDKQVPDNRQRDGVVRSRASASSVSLGAAETLDAAAILKRMKSRYFAGIKRCHEVALKKTPTLKGRLTLRFTIGKAGRVTKSSVKGFDEGLDKCVARQAKRWRFGVPKDDDGNPTTTTVTIPIVLNPS